MKTLKQYLTGTLLVYILGVLSSGYFNFQDWSERSRGVLSVLLGFIYLMIALIKLMDIDDEY